MVFLMLENKSYTEIKQASERNFGIVFAVFFAIIGFYLIIKQSDLYIWFFVFYGIFIFLSFLFPIILKLPNKLWFKLGLFLGSIIAPIIMGLIYFLTVVPIGLILKLFNKDILSQKIKKSEKRYWIERKEPIRSMKDQF